MITRSHQQESLCRAYVQAIAARAGVTWGAFEHDYGIDLSLRSITIQDNRWRDAGVQLDLQLKSTTRAAVTEKAVLYDLDVTAYNDLREPHCPCPRILVVLVMPVDATEWLAQTPEELSIRHCAWWISLRGRRAAATSTTTRVAIPLANIFSAEAVIRMMQRLRERKDL